MIIPAADSDVRFNSRHNLRLRLLVPGSESLAAVRGGLGTRIITEDSSILSTCPSATLPP